MADGQGVYILSPQVIHCLWSGRFTRLCCSRVRILEHYTEAFLIPDGPTMSAAVNGRDDGFNHAVLRFKSPGSEESASRLDEDIIRASERVYPDAAA